MTQKTPINRKSIQAKILKGALWILGISLNQAAAYLAILLFHLQLPYYLAIVFVFTMIFSLSIKNVSRALFYTIASVIIGALITLGIILIPPIYFGSYLMIDYTIGIYSVYISKLLILNIIICTASALIGGLASEA